jgi:hypothetical protein
MNNKLKYSIIISSVIFLILMFVYSNFFAPPSNCQRSQDFIKDSYSGSVQNKFYDQKNPNTITLTMRKNGKPWNLIIPNDTTFFSFIKIGDSLVKNKNQEFIEVHRSSTITNFKINFDC